MIVHRFFASGSKSYANGYLKAKTVCCVDYSASRRYAIFADFAICLDAETAG